MRARRPLWYKSSHPRITPDSPKPPLQESYGRQPCLALLRPRRVRPRARHAPGKRSISVTRRRAEESSETAKVRPHRLRGVDQSLMDEGRVKNSPTRKRITRIIFMLALAALAAASLRLLPQRFGGERVAKAASPSSGTVGPTGPVTPADGKS